MPPNAYSLVSVSARPEKRAINVTFANAQHRVQKSFPFFPSFYLPRTSTTLFETLLAAQSGTRFQTIDHAQSIQVMTGTWSDLKQLAQKLYTQTGYFPLLIEPERQFLLTQNWRYFQTFDSTFAPLPEAFLDTLVPGLAESAHLTLNGLRAHNTTMEKMVQQRMSLSHELFIPYTDVPLALGEQMEVFITNTLFSAQTPLPIENGKPLTMHDWNMEQRTAANTLAFQTPLEGEGSCPCCAPTSIFHQNMHTGSLIECTATQDGVYVHTNNKSISTHFHEHHPGKEKRISRAREWGLSTLPIGPLFRGDTITIPLHDAIDGQRHGTLTPHQPPHAAMWMCRKKGYTLTKVPARLHERMDIHSTAHAQLVQPYLTHYQLAYTIHASQDPRVGLHQTTQKILQEWEKNLPLHLLLGETSWRSPQYTALIQAGIGE